MNQLKLNASRMKNLNARKEKERILKKTKGVNKDPALNIMLCHSDIKMDDLQTIYVTNRF